MPHRLMPRLCMPWEMPPPPQLNPLVVAGAAAALVAAVLLVVSAFVLVWASGRRRSWAPAGLAVLSLALAVGAALVSSWAWERRFISPHFSACASLVSSPDALARTYADTLVRAALMSGLALALSLAALVGGLLLARRSTSMPTQAAA